jgi:hypothetical protein
MEEQRVPGNQDDDLGQRRNSGMETYLVETDLFMQTMETSIGETRS